MLSEVAIGGSPNSIIFNLLLDHVHVSEETDGDHPVLVGDLILGDDRLGTHSLKSQELVINNSTRWIFGTIVVNKVDR